MKIYLKSCSLYEVKNAYGYGIIDGVYLVSGQDDEPCVAPDSDMNSIVRSINGPVFVRATGCTAEEILENSRELLQLGPNIVIKFKLSLEGLKACRALSSRDVSVALDGISSTAQAILGAKAGADFCIFDTKKIKPNARNESNEISICTSVIKLHDLKSEISTNNITDLESLNGTIQAGAQAVEVSYELLMKLCNQ